MILTEAAIKAMKGNSRVKNRLALEMNTSVYSVDRWIKDNEPNGRLTAVRAVQIIAEETELGEEEILETEVVSNSQS